MILLQSHVRIMLSSSQCTRALLCTTLLVLIVAVVPTTSMGMRGVRLAGPTASRHPSSSDRDGSMIYTEEAEADRVTNLPGWGSVDEFALFSGYITVEKAAGRHTFYAFAEARNNPQTAPVILWLNGGPGCSSLGGGFMAELGPWYPRPNGTLQVNPHSWNRFANILFIESPHGVGFSYSERDEDLITGDARTAKDSHAFLLGFFKRFPQYAQNGLFLSGESYAGHYVPQLAWEIVKGNAPSPPQGSSAAPLAAAAAINLRGFLVGNPWTTPAIDNPGAVDFWWSHALISDVSAEGIKANCNFSNIGPLHRQQTRRRAVATGQQQQRLAAISPADEDAVGDDTLCDTFVNRAFIELGNINIYQIYADVCLEVKRGGALRQMAALLRDHPAGLPARVAVAALDKRKALSQAQHRHGPLTASPAAGTPANAYGAAPRPWIPDYDDYYFPPGADDGRPVGPDPAYDPCVDNEVERYLNTPEVQEALHANQTELAHRRLPGQWKDCSDRVLYSRQDLMASVLPVYRNLLRAGLHIMVYSGDVDGIVPVIGTRRWVASLGLAEVNPWRSWTSGTSQVGGYIIDYAGLSLATVRNAGHMVPYTQPERMYHLAKLFLAQARPHVRGVSKAA